MATTPPTVPVPHEPLPAAPTPAGATAPLGRIELLCLQLDDQLYGLPLQLIQELRPLQAALPLPGQDSAALGVMNLRGQVITLLDLRRLLGLPCAADACRQRAVVVLVQQNRHLGLVVDAVVDVLQARPEDFRSLPPGFSHGWLRGLVLAGDRQVLLLHPGA
ncbi:MAG: hypothetical protein GXC94_15470 [Comamonadaceae bacterium]|jgi:chemotaxis signal transduction protein|nr:hypothetical protein [Comamonadaceae bacterium]